jgi:2-polyprenyl-3-methyl-5-hydroxy-6-metoxy-1,4-benzoquinol methylase
MILMPGVLDPEASHLAALRRLQDFTGARVIEVGCGDGRLTLGIAEQATSVLAFDPDEAAVATARAALPRALAGRVTYQVASATDIAITASSCDVVVFSWTL